MNLETHDDVVGGGCQSKNKKRTETKAIYGIKHAVGGAAMQQMQHASGTFVIAEFE